MNIDSNQVLMEQIRPIYSKLEDRRSRQIFAQRLLYSLTGDYECIRQMVFAETAPSLRPLLEQGLRDNEGARRVIWGAGYCGETLYRLFPDLGWECFCDSNPRLADSTFCTLPVIHSSQLSPATDVVFVASTTAHAEMVKALVEKGFSEKQIVNYTAMVKPIFDQLNQTQYFDAEIMRPTPGEIFVDGGCFDGESALLFSQWCRQDYEKIWAFEPDNASYQICASNLAGERAELLPNGLWDQETVLRFNSLASDSSNISEEGTCEIHTACLDQVLPEQKATFIKLDIEGAEYKALLGAKQCITKYKPKLAICLYHKPEDIWELPHLILTFRPDYRFYIRHYSLEEAATILYAI